MLQAAETQRTHRGNGSLAQVPREAAPAERARFAVVSPDTRAADQLANTMRLVKGARFNAATRLEQKAAVSLFTQSIVALYFVGLAVWQAVYVGQIDDATNRLMTFVQLVSSVFTLIDRPDAQGARRRTAVDGRTPFSLRSQFLHAAARA